MSNIGYTLHGNGDRKVIVLHGWMGDSSTFDPVLMSIDKTEYSYAFMDYRGYGKSRKLTGDYSIDEIVGAEVVTQRGGEVKIVPFVEGYSTSKIISSIVDNK